MKIADGQAFFVDANVLVYAAVQDDPRRSPARSLLKDQSQGIVCISPQILVEFYSTITNAKRVTAPLACLEAVEFLEVLLGYPHVRVLPISSDVPARRFDLLRTKPVTGPRVFDLQIVATMYAHGLTALFTYNASDFAAFPGLELLEPAEAS